MRSLLPSEERQRVAKRMSEIVSLVAGVCAVAAILALATNSQSPMSLASKKGLGLKQSDMELLKGALESQKSESHKTCLEMCTTPKCKSDCGDAAAHKAAAAAAKKNKINLNKSDEKLLAEAQKQQKVEYLKACVGHCSTDKCRSACKGGPTATKVHKHLKGSLDLPGSDLKLLQDAQKRQDVEMERRAKAKKNELAALNTNKGDDMSQDLNHQPGEGHGMGDWAPGMRSSAMDQLAKEQQQAKQTAREAQETDDDDSWNT